MNDGGRGIVHRARAINYLLYGGEEGRPIGCSTNDPGTENNGDGSLIAAGTVPEDGYSAGSPCHCMPGKVIWVSGSCDHGIKANEEERPKLAKLHAKA